MTDRCAGAAACRASAASGQAAAAPPSSVMKLRRFNPSPRPHAAESMRTNARPEVSKSVVTRARIDQLAMGRANCRRGIFMMKPWLVREIEPSKNKADSGQDEQHIDRDLKLPIRESLEDAPSEPRAEQRSWNESDRFPVELRQRRGRWPHEIDNEQRDRLHGEDERLIDAALARLVPSLQAAPDGDEGAGKTCEPAGETAKKSGACVRQRSGPQRSARPTQEEIAGIDDQQTSDDMPIGAGRKLQQQIDAGRHAENATNQEHGQTAPVDRTPERSNAERSDCDAADDHHLYGVDRVFHEMKKQGAA